MQPGACVVCTLSACGRGGDREKEKRDRIILKKTIASLIQNFSRKLFFQNTHVGEKGGKDGRSS